MMLWAGAIVIWVVVAAAVNIARHRSYDSFFFDFGHYQQVIYNMAHGRWAESSASGHVLSHWQEHFEPIMLVFAAVYRWLIKPELLPEFLIVGQSLCVGLGLAFMVAIIYRGVPSGWMRRILLISLFLNPLIFNSNAMYFHGDVLALFFLSGMLWAYAAQRKSIYILLALGGLLCKEYVAVLYVLWGISLAIVDKKRFREYGLWLCVVGVAWLLFYYAGVRQWAKHVYGGPGLYPEVRSSADGGLFVAWDDAKALLIIFSAFLFLPLLEWRRLLVIAGLPLAVLLITGSLGDSRRAVTLVPFLLLLSCYGAKKVSIKNKAMVAGVVGLLALSAYHHKIFFLLRTFPQSLVVDHHDRVAKALVAQVLPDESVVASESLAAHLAQRQEISTWGVKFSHDDPLDSAVAIDVPGDLSSGHAARLKRLLQSTHLKPTFYQDGLLLLRQTEDGRNAFFHFFKADYRPDLTKTRTALAKWPGVELLSMKRYGAWELEYEWRRDPVFVAEENPYLLVTCLDNGREMLVYPHVGFYVAPPLGVAMVIKERVSMKQDLMPEGPYRWEVRMISLANAGRWAGWAMRPRIIKGSIGDVYEIKGQ